MQSTLNPDDIFGAVRPLRTEEIFKSRTSRFRARTSSTDWTGTDQLTMQEEKEYICPTDEIQVDLCAYNNDEECVYYCR
jgi:phage baseplate assembly protein gpV